MTYEPGNLRKSMDRAAMRRLVPAGPHACTCTCRVNARLVADMAAVVQEYRDTIHGSECLDDGSVPDMEASRDIQRLDALIARAKAMATDVPDNGMGDPSRPCPSDVQTATDGFDPAGSDATVCAGCGCNEADHRRAAAPKLMLPDLWTIVDGEGTRVGGIHNAECNAHHQLQQIEGTPGSIHGPYRVVKIPAHSTATIRGGHDGDQAASSSSPSGAGLAGGTDVA